MLGHYRWLTLALVIDCYTRQLLGWKLSRSGKASIAAAALEQALITRFGTLGRVRTPFLLRSDNGLVFTSRDYTRLVRSYGLRHASDHRSSTSTRYSGASGDHSCVSAKRWRDSAGHSRSTSALWLTASAAEDHPTRQRRRLQRDVRSAPVEMDEKQIPTAIAPRHAPHNAPATNISIGALPRASRTPSARLSLQRCLG